MLTDIRLQNFKAFADQNIPLRQITLLSGLNSSGKSTVLQALALLRQSYTAGVLSNRDTGLLLNGELVELGTGKDVRHEAWVPTSKTKGGIAITVSDDDHDLAFTAAYAPEQDLLSIVDDLLSFVPEKLDRRSRLFNQHFQYLRADRINPAVSYPRSHDIAIRRKFLGARGEHTVNFLRHYRDELVRPELQQPDAASTDLFRQTEAWLQHLCPGVNLAATGIDGTDTVRLGFSFGTAGLSSSNQYRPTNVGFGLTYSLPIVVACLSSGPGTLLLLENPEAHLHPRGQSAMADLLARTARAGAQVIVESHSDHVLNGMRIAVKNRVLTPDQLGLLYFHADSSGTKHVEQLEVSGQGSVLRWPDGFFDEWDRALDELID
ncbi:DUF3696 domain-containing protein [Nocardia sp. NPDC006044]|uniref:DUF3696 domain-containing protein n=1 Tax=Nocardia sp. NPDC006044 TaxID=3364306 RepID=UPI0036A2924A